MASKDGAPNQQQMASSGQDSARLQDSARSYGSFAESLPSVEQMDAKMPKKMQSFCNDWVVGIHQFDEMESPGGAVICARVIRLFLIFFILTSTTALIVGFVFKATLAAPVETEQFAGLLAPSVAICPSPWGSKFKSFQIARPTKGVIPGEEVTPLDSANWTVRYNPEGAEGRTEEKKVEKKGLRKGMEKKKTPQQIAAEKAMLAFQAQLHDCRFVEIENVELNPLGFVAQYAGFETIRVSFNATTQDGTFKFGFFNGDNELPQRWNSAELGKRNTGEIKYDQVNVGATEVSDGTPRSILYFESNGAVPSQMTQVEYYYGYFMVRNLAAQAKGFSLWKWVAFILLFSAALNNCGLFDLFFKEVSDDGPPPLEPSIVCQAICGSCFPCCRRRKEDGDAEAEAESNAEQAS